MGNAVRWALNMPTGAKSTNEPVPFRVARFFDENRVEPGDPIVLEQIEPYLYRVFKR